LFNACVERAAGLDDLSLLGYHRPDLRYDYVMRPPTGISKPLQNLVHRR
jgi:hypothetical protein